jgi:hypothetical protein
MERVGGVFASINCVDRAFRNADGTVDALVRVDDQEIGAFPEAVDGADIDTIRVFAFDARVGYDMGHSGPLAAGAG